MLSLTDANAPVSSDSHGDRGGAHVSAQGQGGGAWGIPVPGQGCQGWIPVPGQSRGPSWGCPAVTFRPAVLQHVHPGAARCPPAVAVTVTAPCRWAALPGGTDQHPARPPKPRSAPSPERSTAPSAPGTSIPPSVDAAAPAQPRGGVPSTAWSPPVCAGANLCLNPA